MSHLSTGRRVTTPNSASGDQPFETHRDTADEHRHHLARIRGQAERDVRVELMLAEQLSADRAPEGGRDIRRRLPQPPSGGGRSESSTLSPATASSRSTR
jgi:hypothetical protein